VNKAPLPKPGGFSLKAIFAFLLAASLAIIWLTVAHELDPGRVPICARPG